ncbi:MAG: hypothetical protein HC815_36430 [Richelia sp. RM1_1_1]|nr:hypothetical protein [Richelia sp. RM1_1_1]
MQWLEAIDGFNYQPPQFTGYTYVRHNITVKKRSNGKFYAIRTVNCCQRVKYLGKPCDLDYERLQLAVDELSLDDWKYHQLKSKNQWLYNLGFKINHPINHWINHWMILHIHYLPD